MKTEFIMRLTRITTQLTHEIRVIDEELEEGCDCWCGGDNYCYCSENLRGKRTRLKMKLENVNILLKAEQGGTDEKFDLLRLYDKFIDLEWKDYMSDVEY